METVDSYTFKWWSFDLADARFTQPVPVQASFFPLLSNLNFQNNVLAPLVQGNYIFQILFH